MIGRACPGRQRGCGEALGIEKPTVDRSGMALRSVPRSHEWGHTLDPHPLRLGGVDDAVPGEPCVCVLLAGSRSRCVVDEESDTWSASLELPAITATSAIVVQSPQRVQSDVGGQQPILDR